jgi:hypothetical protein
VRLYPDLFDNNIEHARCTVKVLIGQDSNRSSRGDLTKHLPTFKIEVDFTREDTSWQIPFVIPSGITEMMIMGDFHGVYMDKQAVEDAVAASAGIKTLLINGDLLDNHWLGRWRKNRDVPLPAAEFEFVAKLLEQLKKHFNQIYFKEGNHDDWLARYVGDNAAPLETMKEIKLAKLLRLDELGIKRIHNLQEVRFGDLSILHGHEKPGTFAAINLAETVLRWWQFYERRWDVKVLVNHFHRLDQCVKTGVDESFGRAYVNGCLCDTRPVYTPYGRHNHGVTHVRQNKGITEVNLIPL